ncbi:MAG: F0F1 ATP synthase subunit epsilon [Candidatus Moranbacteria bacterium]|nr:F0F1 ATP synthase subunit epsilon [Candidatus Moranbacteria bacterium]
MPCGFYVFILTFSFTTAVNGKKIKFKIVTPEKTVYEDSIDQVTLPTQEGEITVLPNHIPLISVLAPGELVAKKDGEEIAMAVSGGMVEVRKNEITILADTAERAEEIDIKRAEEAKDRAEKLKEERIQTDEVQYATVAAIFEKNLARIKVARKHLTRRGMRIE